MIAAKTTIKTAKSASVKKSVNKTAKVQKEAKVKKKSNTLIEPVKKEIEETGYDLVAMLQAGVHFGHQSRRWNPKMKPYIWKQKDGIHIFDLLKTTQYLLKACEAVKQFIKEGKTIVYVGTKRQAAEIIKAEALRANVAYVSTRWPGGVITNWKQIKGRIDHLLKLEKGLTDNTFSHYTKRERVLLMREVNRLKRIFGGIETLTKIPDALFIIDILREKTAIREARKAGIKVFAIVDSNVDPSLVDHPIPGNDDAKRSIKLLASAFTDAVIEGQALKGKENI